MQNRVFFFTHIPKTGGTSLKQSLIWQNIPRDQMAMFLGYRDLLLHPPRGFWYLEGHYSYGIHHWIRSPLNGEPYYIVVLREPLDQAISYYFFVLQCNYSHYQHPNLIDAQTRSLAEFYQLPRYQNMQTRQISGWPWSPLLSHLPRGLGAGALLQQAMDHLSSAYGSFGLLEQLDRYQQILAEELGWINHNIRNQSKVTRSRPQIADLDRDTIAAIRAANSLDFQLYEYAQDLFARRYPGAGL